MSFRSNRPQRERVERPLGITVISVLNAIGVVGLVLLGLALLGRISILLAFITFGLSAAYAKLTLGLWRLEPWAWGWAIGLYLLNVLLFLVTGDILGVIVQLAVAGYIYLKADVFR